MAAEEPSYDVAVVGAGLSGLFAAKLLKARHVKVLVLEGRDRIQGRTWTIKDTKYGYVEAGAAYVGAQQKKLLQVVKELGLETYSLVTQELNSLMILKDFTTTYSSAIPTIYNPFILLDLNNLMTTMDKLSKQVPVDRPWDAPKAREWDDVTVETFLKKTCWTRTAYTLGRIAVMSFMVTEPDEISLLYLLQQIRMCGGVTAMSSIENGLQAMKIKGGSGMVSDKLAEYIKDEIIYNAFVTSIKDSNDGIHITTEQGKIFKAKRVILAIPFSIYKNITFEPKLPIFLQEFSEIEPLSNVMKTFMIYETPFWKKHGLSGELISEDGWITYAVDDSTRPGNTLGILVGFVDGRDCKEFTKKTKEERKHLVCEQYAEKFGLPEFMKPLHYVDMDWRADPDYKYSRGLCVLSLPPGLLTKHKRLPGDEPFGRIHFSGTETALTFRAYMDGALRAGERAVIEVLQALGKNVDETLDPVQIVDVPYARSVWIEPYLPSLPQFCALLVIAISVVPTLYFFR